MPYRAPEATNPEDFENTYSHAKNMSTGISVLTSRSARVRTFFLGLGRTWSTKGANSIISAAPAASIVYVGKESNQLDDVEQGTVHDRDEVQQVYRDPKRDPWLTQVVPVLKIMPRRELARLAGISERHVKRLRGGYQKPSDEARTRLTRAAADYARTRLGTDAPADDLAACAAFLDLQRQRTPTRGIGPQSTAVRQGTGTAVHAAGASLDADERHRGQEGGGPAAAP